MTMPINKSTTAVFTVEIPVKEFTRKEIERVKAELISRLRIKRSWTVNEPYSMDLLRGGKV